MTGNLALLLTCASLLAAQDGIQWPQFRGPRASGVAEGFPTPVRWNVASGEGVKWRTPLPGLGHSSPVIWGDRLFVTSAVDSENESTLKVGLYGSIGSVTGDAAQTWKVFCLNKNTGKVIWERTAHRGMPRKPRHPKSTHANPTAATDGTHVVAFFGSEGVFCYDMEGNLLWKKDLGVLDSGFFQAPEAQWGFASSPIIHDGKLLLQCDVLREQFLLALDVSTGEELWRTGRADYPTWSTPTVAPRNGGFQVVVNGFKHIGGYGIETGDELWRMRGGGDIPVPTPVVGNGLVFISNAHGGASPVLAVRLSAQGDISLAGGQQRNEHIAWSIERGGSYLPTPLVYRDSLYVCRDNGVLSAYNATTGARHYQQRLGTGATGFTPSMVAADGKIYITSEDGDVYVLRAGPKFDLLATNEMDEVCMASPAISAGVLYWRTRSHIVAIGE